MLIYKITNKLTGKYYIGKSTLSREKFLKSKYYGSGLYIKRAIELYGIENFIRDILCECSSLEELNKMERHWIKELNSIIPNGYNIQMGGSSGNIGIVRSEEWKKNCGNGRKGKPAWNKGLKKGIDEKMKNCGVPHSMITREKQRRASVGKPKSEAHKIHISEVQKGKPSHRKGIPTSSETKEKQRKAKIGFVPWNKGKKGIYTPESIEKMRKSRLKNIEKYKNEGKSWNGN